jgi:hypothetical protein
VARDTALLIGVNSAVAAIACGVFAAYYGQQMLWNQKPESRLALPFRWKLAFTPSCLTQKGREARVKFIGFNVAMSVLFAVAFLARWLGER